MVAAFLPVVLLLGIGVLLGRAELGGQKVLPERASDTLNQVVLFVCLPAAVLHHVPPIVSGGAALELAWLALVPWALVLVAAIAVKLAARVLHLGRGEEGALLMTVALGNTSFLGYPVIRALLGEDALASAVVFDQLGSFLALSTYGTVVLAHYGGGSTPSARELAGKVVRFPPFIALLIAIALGLGGVILPDPLASAVELLSGAMLPLVLLALGLGLELSLPKKDRAPLAVGLALKLLVLPALVLGALVLSGERGEPAQVALLESAMPPMVTAGALAAGQKLAPELSRAMTGVGLILAMVTLPLFSWIGALLLGG